MNTDGSAACPEMGTASHHDSAPVTRRALLGHVNLLCGTFAAAAALGPDALIAGKKHKGKKKEKQKDKSLSVKDFLGSWNTALSSGVTGIATFHGDALPLNVTGVYINSVGSGSFRCTIHEGGTSLHCRYKQGDGETGGFIATLNGKNSWIGKAFIDLGGSFTFTGVRRR